MKSARTIAMQTIAHDIPSLFFLFSFISLELVDVKSTIRSRIRTLKAYQEGSSGVTTWGNISQNTRSGFPKTNSASQNKTAKHNISTHSFEMHSVTVSD